MEKSVKISAMEDAQHKFLTRTYSLMGIALLISAASAFVVTQSESLVKMLFAGRAIGFMALAIAELVLVFVLSATIRKLSVVTATFMFMLYSVINGLTISSIFFVYKIESIFGCFISAAVMFLVMSVFGATTKKNLHTFGRYLLMALIGVLIASLVTWLFSFIFPDWNYGMIDWIISIVTVLIFTALTAYDTQKVFKTSEFAIDNDDYKKVAVLGALELYLDFINIFLHLLRLFGKRRD